MKTAEEYANAIVYNSKHGKKALKLTIASTIQALTIDLSNQAKIHPEWNLVETLKMYNTIWLDIIAIVENKSGIPISYELFYKYLSNDPALKRVLEEAHLYKEETK